MNSVGMTIIVSLAKKLVVFEIRKCNRRKKKKKVNF